MNFRTLALGVDIILKFDSHSQLSHPRAFVVPATAAAVAASASVVAAAAFVL